MIRDKKHFFVFVFACIFSFTFQSEASQEWWQKGIIYQLYPKSFKDSNGDGIGDFQGIISKLDYLNDGTENSLGVDAIWINPFYPSPQVDSGYDVADYTNIDPIFGTLDDFRQLVEEAHKRNMKVIVDFVPNHCSTEHKWFKESRTSKTNPKSDWFYWRDAKSGDYPNNWRSMFSGVAWEWVEDRKQFYLHSFAKEQADLNWRNPDVKETMLNVLKFWLELGVDGFRMDVVYMVMKKEGLPDQPWSDSPRDPKNPRWSDLVHIYDQNDPDIHPLARDMRSLLNSFGDKIAIAELWLEIEEWVKYYGQNHDEFHLPFNFWLISIDWNAKDVSNHVKEIEKATKGKGWPNYVLGNHDQHRLASTKGIHRARNAAVFLLTVRGTPTMFYADELGKQDTEIDPAKCTDPQFIIDPTLICRDVARTPMQWDSSKNAGFSESDQTWLPVASDYNKVNVEAYSNQGDSILNLYRNLIWLRKRTPALNSGEIEFIESNQPNVLSYRRYSGDSSYSVVLNLTDKPVEVLIEGLNGEVLFNTYLQRKNEQVFKLVQLEANEGIIIRDA